MLVYWAERVYKLNELHHETGCFLPDSLMAISNCGLTSHIYHKYLDSYAWVNRVDPDQTSPTLFAIQPVLFDMSPGCQTSVVSTYSAQIFMVAMTLWSRLSLFTSTVFILGIWIDRPEQTV